MLNSVGADHPTGCNDEPQPDFLVFESFNVWVPAVPDGPAFPVCGGGGVYPLTVGAKLKEGPLNGFILSPALFPLYLNLPTRTMGLD